MLQRIETENGKRWAVVFNRDDFRLDEIVEMQKGLVNTLISVTQTDFYDSSPMDFFETLKWLNESFLNTEQCVEFERGLKPRES